ncbi:MAG TPA: ATP-binding protein [Nitrososphaeraceae archaeon]|nr:ATP-binding protein [Nitrososphaeraceae archaeon]
MSYNFLSSNDKRIHILKYVLLPSIYLSVIAIISTNENLWRTSPIDHYYIELFGTILAGILAFYYIYRGSTFNDKFSLFIGIGFLVNALIDLLHVVVSLLNTDNIVFLKYFIPQTWFAGRLFLSTMLIIAITKYFSFSSTSISNIQKQNRIQTDTNRTIEYNKSTTLLLLYLIIAALFSSIIAISSLFIIFPFSVIDNIPVHRPYELLPLGLLIISLYYFYKNGIYKYKDILYISIVISIVADIFGQIIMSYSANYFDTSHSVAHVLKDLGYFINVVGLALSSIQYNKRFRESNRKLTESNRKLTESNELLNQQYEKVKESEKMKSEFINIAAHELRTPIQPILGLTDVIYSKIKDEEQRQFLEIIMRNAQRLKRLTDNVLDVTKIESNSLKLNKEILNLNTFISEILKIYVNQLVKQQMANIVYNFKHTADIIVEADKDRVSQVIYNLLDNALKFTPQDHMIFVIIDKKIDEKEVQAIVSVKDNGKGIPDEILSRLFIKLSPTDSSTGTGLGLYICKNIVEAHGGKIWAENNPDHKGAIFRFTLPIVLQTSEELQQIKTKTS